MGGGVSSFQEEEKSFVTQEEAKALAGDAFDEDLWNKKARDDGTVTVGLWNEAVAAAAAASTTAEGGDPGPNNSAVPGPAATFAEAAAVRVEALSVADAADAGSSLSLRVEAMLALDEAGKQAQKELVLSTVEAREKERKREAKAKAKAANADYSKGLSGTAEDTKAEKDFADLMKETDGRKELPTDRFAEILCVVKPEDTDRYEELRGFGEWVKVQVIHGDGLPGVGYIHTITCEEAFSKPHDYVEPQATEEKAEDPYAGLATCDMEDILECIATTIQGVPADEAAGAAAVEPKTPLLVDNSEEGKMLNFFKYKGVVVELEALGWSRKRQAAEKVQAGKVMEECRRRCVVAMKHGKTLCLNVGSMGQGCMFKEVFCKETTLNALAFEEGGRRLIAGKPKPFCKKMWKDKEMTSGEIVIDPEFCIVVLTSHPPGEVLRELAEPLPLEHLSPIVVTFGS